MNVRAEKLYIVLISVHGLIRGEDLELGRNADTGGQTKYVVELARALGEHPDVGRVELMTRLISDPQFSEDYAQPVEKLSSQASIIRIPCGEPGYIAKEELWDSLDNFSDHALAHINSSSKKRPDIIHSHYADAGYVGIRLAHHLGVPLVHTGHSLGRSKRQHLLATGLKGDEIEQRYNLSRRIEAEEDTLATAELIITSTRQEIEKQYELYDHYQPEQMRVVPPGTDLDRFHPPVGNEHKSAVYKELCRFLQKPEKPIILALSRPDERKNISTLIQAFGESKALQKAANLAIIAGNRDDIRNLESGAQEVLTDILLTIDQYDLYGKVAAPKQHQPNDVPIFYRLAALSGGVFVNPALIEPFGLTLIEAAASGLPIVSTEDGGPRDIIENCQNGLLIDPLDTEAIANALLQVQQDRKGWKKLAASGIEGVRRHYSWQAHVEKYLGVLRPLIERTTPSPRMPLSRRPMLYRNQAIITDLDQNLLGDPASLEQLIKVIQDHRKQAVFAIATGRSFNSAMRTLRHYRIPQPDILISGLGTEIHYSPNLDKDTAWTEHIDYLWKPRSVRRILSELPGLKLQPIREQGSFKISYYYDAAEAPPLEAINSLLHKHELSVNVFLAFGQYLDIVPVRASKGYALRWFAEQWNIPLEHVLAAGGSGSDEDTMRGNTLAVVVANRHHEELSSLIDVEQVFFPEQPFAAGILEAIEHYNFFDIGKA